MSYEAELAEHYAGVRARLGRYGAPVVRPSMLEVKPAAPKVDTVPVRMLPRRSDVRRIVNSMGLASNENSPFRWRGIVDEVCQKHNCTYGEILGTRRQPRIVHARHEVFYRLSKETTMSLPRIGKFMGGKDHTSVMHGITAHAKRIGALQ